MNEWSLPCLTLAALAPALAATAARRSLTRRAAFRLGVATTLGVLLLTIAASAVLQASGRVAAHDRLDLGSLMWGAPLFVIDELSSLLLPFAALIFAIVVLVTPRTVALEHLLRRILFSESVVLASFLSSDPFALSLLWTLSTVGAYLELRHNGDDGQGAARVLATYMVPSCILFAVGAVAMRMDGSVARAAACALIATAVLIRKGIVPLHSWMPVMFVEAPLPASVLFNAPQLGAWVAVRVLVPNAPAWVLEAISVASLVTAVYGAGLALVQVEARRAFAWLFLSQSAIILVGLGSPTTIALAGGLSLWISTGLALTGFGMTIAALEARRGRLSLAEFAGGYERKPQLAACFLLLGLASVGFPGTLGFVGQEALVDGVVSDFPYAGYAVMVASMLNGITVLRTYFVLFCGRRERSASRQSLQPRERLGFAALAALLLLGGLFPAPFVRSRSRAVEGIRSAQRLSGTPCSEDTTSFDTNAPDPLAARDPSVPFP